MTLNNTNQLYDLLGTLTPQLQGYNQGSAMHSLRNPNKIKDSLTLNTHRVQQHPNSPGEIQLNDSRKHNNSILSRLSPTNAQEKIGIIPEGVNLQNLKKRFNRQRKQKGGFISPQNTTLASRISPLNHTIVTNSHRPHSRFKSVRFNRPSLENTGERRRNTGGITITDERNSKLT